MPQQAVFLFQNSQYLAAIRFNQSENPAAARRAPCHCRAVTGGGCGNLRGFRGKI